MLRPGTFPMTALLALLAGIGPLSVDMYLASLPDIGRTLEASPPQVQLTLSSYLIGFAVGQLIYGPLSDRHGRRPALLAAVCLYVAGSFACTIAPSIELLIAGRFVQAFGGSGMVVLARAVVRDMYEGERVGRELSLMASIMGLAPIVAPLIGGFLQTAFGWRSNFVVLFFVGAAAAIAIWQLLPETLRQRAPEPVSIGSTLHSFRQFLKHRSYVANLGISTCAFIGLFAWIFTATFVLQDIHGMSPAAFGVTFAICSAGFIVGTGIAARFVMRWGTDRTMGLGTAVMATGGVAMVIAQAMNAGTPLMLLSTMAVFLVGMGLTLPLAQAGALLPFPKAAGSASSLMGSIQQTATAVLGSTIGYTLGASAWPLAATVGAAGLVALALWLTTRRARSAS